jgi:hypothetical protein
VETFYYKKMKADTRCIFPVLSGITEKLMFLAISSDGLTWAIFRLPVLYPGAWELGTQGVVPQGPVLFEDGIYKMFYHGFYDVYSPQQLANFCRY